MCGVFIYQAHQQVLLSSIASPYLIPKLGSTIWSAKGDAPGFRVHCPQPPRLPVCGTWTEEPDWKLQEGRDAVSTGTVSLGPELDKQATPPPTPPPAVAEKREQTQGMAVLWPSSHSQLLTLPQCPSHRQACPRDQLTFMPQKPPFAAVFTHRTGVTEDPGPELGQGSAKAQVGRGTCGHVSPAPSRAGSRDRPLWMLAGPGIHPRNRGQGQIVS